MLLLENELKYGKQNKQDINKSAACSKRTFQKLLTLQVKLKTITVTFSIDTITAIRNVILHIPRKNANIGENHISKGCFIKPCG